MPFKKQILTLLVIFPIFQIYAGITVLNGLTHIHNTQKGNTITGEIVLKNMNQTESERFNVFIKDFDQSCDAQDQFLEIGSIERTLGKWIFLNTTERVLKPNEKYILKYTIKIPDNIELKKDYGSFWSNILIEGDQVIDETITSEGLKISSKIRYGVQMIVNIGEQLNPEIEFINIELNKKNEATYEVDVVIENKGDFLIKPTLLLELFNNEGEDVYKTKAQFKKLYPESCKNFMLNINKVPKGSYEGVLVADYGADMYAINLSIDIE